MAVSLEKCRWMLVACVVLIVAVALVVALGVIPPVRGATVPDISPEDAVLAFRMAAVLHLLVALAILLIATLSKGRSKPSTFGLVTAGIVVLFLGFALSDAALAFGEAGTSMRTVTLLLLVCVAADALGGALTVATAFLRPRRERMSQ